MRFLLLLLLTSSCLGQDYSPYVQIVSFNGDEARQYSGVVFNETDSRYEIVTCAHGTQDIPEVSRRIQTSAFNVQFGAVHSVAIKTTLIKQDPDIDLAYMYIPKVVKINPVELATDSLIGTKCLSYGYVNSEEIRNPVVVHSYNTYRTVKGSSILSCEGKLVNGLSGGPLVFNNRIYGIQSGGSKHVLYCPSDQIVEFVDVARKEEIGKNRRVSAGKN